MQSSVQAVILAGGLGTRLRGLHPDVPKALAPVAGRPFLQWQIEWLARGGVKAIHLALGYKAESVIGWLRETVGSEQLAVGSGREAAGRGQLAVDSRQGTEDGGRKAEDGRQRTEDGGRETAGSERFPPLPSPLHCPLPTAHCPLPTANCPLAITYSIEPAPLGTGGALKFCEPQFTASRLLVVNGDTLLPGLDLPAMVEGQVADPTRVQIAVVPVDDASRSGTVRFDDAGYIGAFLEKGASGPGWVNGGVYLLQASVLGGLPAGTPLSIEKDIFPALLRDRRLLAFRAAPPLLDMGTEEGIRTMESYLRSR